MATVIDDPDILTEPGLGHEDSTDEWLGLDKPWNVVLWNDSVTPADAVVVALIQVIGLDQTKAVEAMVHIHNNGKGIVATTHQEKAELLREQLQNFNLGSFQFKLTVTLEQAE